MSYWTDAAWNEAHEVVPVVRFREVTTPTAVIEHTCTACRGTIRVGRPYRREVGMAVGDEAPTVIKEHLPDCYVEAEDGASQIEDLPEFYQAVEDGRKTFEARYNDRNFKVDDTLELEEYDPEKGLGTYTGRRLHFRVSYVLHGGGFGIERGYVIMGLKPLEETKHG